MTDDSQYCLVWTAESVLYQPISKKPEVTREAGDSYALVDINKKTVVFNDMELHYDASLDHTDDSFPDKIIDFLENERASYEMDARFSKIEADSMELHDKFQDHLDIIASIEKRFSALLTSHTELQKKYDELYADHENLKAVSIDIFQRTKKLLERK